MKIQIYKNHAKIAKDSTFEQQLFLNSYLTTTEIQKKMSGGKKKVFSINLVEHKLYEEIEADIIFPRGFTEYLRDIDGITLDERFTDYLRVPSLSADEIEIILQPESGFNLRKDQVIAIRKCILLKRGIIQMPPGSGKTEVQSAVLKILSSCNPNLKALVIEPTTELGRGTLKRFLSYNLDASFYSEDRNTNSSIIIAHVSALLNDLEVDPAILDDFNVVIFDECHHKSCDTWSALNFALKNVEYSLGFSALAIDEKNIKIDRYLDMSFEEKLIAGSTGVVLFHLNSSYYINKGFLATPVVFEIDNFIDNKLNGNKVWASLFAEGISSNDRNTLVAEAINVFYKHERKILILVGTKEQAFVISTALKEINRGAVVGISFGSSVSYLLNEQDIDPVRCKENVVDLFNSDKLNILLATTHLDEGIDIKNLDVCVLASGGKKDRRLIQRLGRVLRKTKNGRYAYIIDFADKGNGILSRHAKHRVSLYKNLIEIPSSNIYHDTTISEMEKNFITLEGI